MIRSMKNNKSSDIIFFYYYFYLFHRFFQFWTVLHIIIFKRVNVRLVNSLFLFGPVSLLFYYKIWAYGIYAFAGISNYALGSYNNFKMVLHHQPLHHSF